MNPYSQRTTGYLTALCDTFLKKSGTDLDGIFKDIFSDIKMESFYSFVNENSKKQEYCDEESYSKVADMYYGGTI